MLRQLAGRAGLHARLRAGPLSSLAATSSNSRKPSLALSSSPSSSAPTTKDAKPPASLAAKPRFESFYDPKLPISRFFDNAADKTAVSVGRAWSAEELRNKSFEDLQKLYMLMLMERNKLLAERYRSRRMGLPMKSPHRCQLIRQSMARLLTVVRERSRERSAMRAAIRMPNLADLSKAAKRTLDRGGV
jgi:ribosomal protein L29